MQRAPGAANIPLQLSFRSPQRPRVLHPRPEGRWKYRAPPGLLKEPVKPRLHSVLGRAQLRGSTPLRAALAPATCPASSLPWVDRLGAAPPPTKSGLGLRAPGRGTPSSQEPQGIGATAGSGSPGFQSMSGVDGGARAKPEERGRK